MGKRVSKVRLTEALRNNAGLITATARAVGLTRQAIYKRINADPTLAEVLRDIRDEHLDIAEAALIGAMRNQNVAAIRFYLETIGKERGYTKRLETTGADGGPIRVDLSGVSDADLAKLTSAVQAGVTST